MSSIDLHIHSIHSPDAELPVTEILECALKNGVKTISITDHNTVKAHKEISNNKIVSEIKIIPGVELDCTYKGKTFHLLGYYIDFKSIDFEDWEKDFIRRELGAVPKRIKKLQDLGMKISESEVFERAKGQTIPQEELMAEIILEDNDNRHLPILTPYFEGGSRSDQPFIHFFWDFFGHGKAAHVPVEYLNISEAIDMVKSNGGIPILAHPGANFKEDINFIDEIVSHGVSGIGVFSTYHAEKQIDMFKKYAIDKKLLMTCGSDFHGRNKPLISIGNFDCYGLEDDILKNLNIQLKLS